MGSRSNTCSPFFVYGGYMLSDCPNECLYNANITINVTAPATATATPMTMTVSNTSGSLPAGAKSASFYNYGPADVLINGTVLPSGATISFPFLGSNISYGEISYDATSSTIRIDWTVIS